MIEIREIGYMKPLGNNVFVKNSNHVEATVWAARGTSVSLRPEIINGKKYVPFQEVQQAFEALNGKTLFEHHNPSDDNRAYLIIENDENLKSFEIKKAAMGLNGEKE